MKRRRPTEMAFSFFLFQDLITGLSGLMIFLVILMLLDQDLAADPSAQPAAVSPETAGALQEANDDLKRLRAEAEFLDGKKQALSHSPFRVLFALAGDGAGEKSVLLIECSAEAFSYQPSQAGAAAPVTLNDPDLNARSRRLLGDLAAFPPATHDLLLLIKPTAFLFGQDLIDVMKKKGYRVGTEPLEENRSGLRW